MDKASASGAGDSRFESWAGQALTGVSSRSSGSQRLEAQFLKWIFPSRFWCKARARHGLPPRSQAVLAARARNRVSAVEKSAATLRRQLCSGRETLISPE